MQNQNNLYVPQVPGTGILGVSGPTRAIILPDSAKERKCFPVASGFMDYFPDAICAVAGVSYRGNEQHNPGQPLHWAREKSTDEADTMLRHFLQRGTRDSDGIRHSAKMAWRALALLQKEIEAEQAASINQQPTALIQQAAVSQVSLSYNPHIDSTIQAAHASADATGVPHDTNDDPF